MNNVTTQRRIEKREAVDMESITTACDDVIDCDQLLASLTDRRRDAGATRHLQAADSLAKIEFSRPLPYDARRLENASVAMPSDHHQGPRSASAAAATYSSSEKIEYSTKSHFHALQSGRAPASCSNAAASSADCPAPITATLWPRKLANAVTFEVCVTKSGGREASTAGK